MLIWATRQFSFSVTVVEHNSPQCAVDEVVCVWVELPHYSDQNSEIVGRNYPSIPKVEFVCATPCFNALHSRFYAGIPPFFSLYPHIRVHVRSAPEPSQWSCTFNAGCFAFGFQAILMILFIKQVYIIISIVSLVHCITIPDMMFFHASTPPLLRLRVFKTVYHPSFNSSLC